MVLGAISYKLTIALVYVSGIMDAAYYINGLEFVSLRTADCLFFNDWSLQ